MKIDKTTKSKISLIGTGMVGSSFAYSLVQSGLASQLVLIDANVDRAKGEEMDLNHGLPFVAPMKIFAGSYEDLYGSDVVVVTAGHAQKPGESRLELAQRNAEIMSEIVKNVVYFSPEAIIVIATNPVDVMTYVATKVSELPRSRVIGSGTILDTARVRYLLANLYSVDIRNVHAYIIGEHGDSEVPVWSLANIAGIRLKDYLTSDKKKYEQKTFDQIFQQTKNAAQDIIRCKSATYYAIGLGLLKIVESILRNEKTIITVSSLMNGLYGVTNVAISLPAVIGRKGIEGIIELPMSFAEIEAFRKSASVLKKVQDSLDIDKLIYSPREHDIKDKAV